MMYTCIICILSTVSAQHNVLYVSPDAVPGRGTGALATPFTLDDARDHLRLDGSAAGTAVVLRGGDYFLREPFVLSEMDGGEPGRPVEYRSFPGERARLLGGLPVPVDAFVPVPGGDGLLVLDLSKLGIANASVLGGADTDPGQLKAELFVDTQGEGGVHNAVPLRFAQDPNPLGNGSWLWYGYNNILAFKGNSFLFNNTEMVERGQWQKIVQSPRGLYLLSHWGEYGHVSANKVESIIPVLDDHRNITSYNISMAMSTSRYTAGTSRFVALDALEFVDIPGEYWIDRLLLKLYMLPPPTPTLKNNTRIFLSVTPSLAASSGPPQDRPLPRGLVEVQASWVTLTNLTVAISTQSLLIANGVDGLDVSGCDFEGAGALCAHANGSSISLHANTFEHCGGSGLVLRGGNWNQPGPTLFQPANITVTNNLVHHWARWQRGGEYPGVSWSGVGHIMRQNTIRDGPVIAVLAEGNVDCIFEQNLINHTTFEQTDMGAYYHGSSSGGYSYAWTQPGNVIRNNTFSHVHFMERRPPEDEYMSTNAVYMDDVMAHYTIEYNTFIDVDVGVLVGGGLRHTVTNNTFVSCGTQSESACMRLDNRGMNWAHELCGCRCKFGVCSPGCHNGAALGPGLHANLTAGPDSFRFEQGQSIYQSIDRS